MSIMKQIRVILCSILLLGGAFLSDANAQINLRVSAILNFPDTAILNQNVPAIVIIENTGSIPYQGALSVGIATDSSSGTTNLLYFGTQPIIILPLDTVWLVPSNGYTFTNPVFKLGNNVVVVWPISTQSITVDSLYTGVYINGVLGVNDKLNEPTIKVVPNPASDFISLRDLNNSIESVRIYSTLGNLMFESSTTNDQQKDIDISNFSSGLYIVRITNKDKRNTSLKFFKE
jgi:hypothetical protein